MEKPLLSIVIPFYNSAKYIDACLKSVLAQDLKEMEVICVDDASTDETLKVLYKYAELDSRIKVISFKENWGRLKPRCAGVESACGEYLMFIDSDDTIDSGLCTTVVDLMKKHQVDILQFPARQIYTELKKQNVIYPPAVHLTGDEILRKSYVEREVPISLWMKVYQMELCKKAFAEIPDIRCYAGADFFSTFFIDYFAKSYMGVNTEPKYNYYLGYGLTSAVNMPLNKFQQYCDMNQYYAIVYDFLERNHASEEAYEALYYMTRNLIGECCNYFANVKDEEKIAAVDIFWKSWSGIPHFSEHILFAFDQQKKTIDEIKNSESYKIGNTIVNPLKAVKARLVLMNI